MSTLTLNPVTKQDAYSTYNNHLNYLIDNHKKYMVCFTPKEHRDKSLLEEKIRVITLKVYKLKKQLKK